MSHRTSFRSILAAAMALCLLLATVPAFAAPLMVESPTHESEDTWYSDDSPTFEWDTGGLPSIEGTINPTGTEFGLDVAGDVAYIASYNQGMTIVDISEPGTPAVLASIDTTGFANDIDIEGDVAYVADGAEGLVAFDITDPTTPALLGAVDTTGSSVDLQVEGDVAYVADYSNGLQMIDVSDPSAPTTITAIDTVRNATGVAVQGDAAFVSVYDKGLEIYSVTVPSAPALLGTLDTSGIAWDVTVAGDTAYVASGSGGLYIMDVSEPGTPTLHAAYDTPGNAFSVDVAGDQAYVLDQSGEMHVIDVSDPDTPVLVSTLTVGTDSRDIVADGERALIADGGTGLKVLTLLDPWEPVSLGQYDSSVTAKQVAVAGDVAYVAQNTDGLLAFDVSDPMSPALLDTWATSDQSLDVAVDGDVAYVADLNDGFRALDVSVPDELVSLDVLDISGQAPRAVTLSGDVAYVPASGYFWTVDISNPTNLTLLDSVSTSGTAWEVAVDGDVAYLADYTAGVSSFDISDPSNITFLDSWDSDYTSGVCVAGDVLYVADSGNGFHTFDISDPSNMTLLDTYDTPSSAQRVAVAGDLAYVANFETGLYVFDISDPAAITLVDNVDAGGDHNDVDLEGDVIWVASGWDGLRSYQVGYFPTGYSYSFDQTASTDPDTISEGATYTVSYSDVADGESYFHVRSVGRFDAAGDTSHRRVRIDTTMPTVDADVQPTYQGSATINITGADPGGSGINSVTYELDGGGSVTTAGDTKQVTVDTLGEHSITYWSRDLAYNWSTKVTVDFEILADTTTYHSLAGNDRYETAIKVSKEAYPSGAGTVVVATATNWPDALGGAALAGAVDGPILLVTPTSIPGAVQTEIDRLGATSAYVLGGTGAVSQAVEDSLISQMGAGNVTRLGGASRYSTANLIAEETIDVLGGAYDGTAFVTTGGNFPDALAGSPLAASQGWPIFLATPDAAPSTVMQNLGVTDVFILGGEGAVAGSIETDLEGVFGGANVDRLAGNDRYSTGVTIATYGVDTLGLSWNHLAIATGLNFPDALAGGVLPATNGSVMLLTATDSLPTSVGNALTSNRDAIADVYYLGGTGAVSQDVRDAVEAKLN